MNLGILMEILKSLVFPWEKISDYLKHRLYLKNTRLEVNRLLDHFELFLAEQPKLYRAEMNQRTQEYIYERPPSLTGFGGSYYGTQRDLLVGWQKIIREECGKIEIKIQRYQNRRLTLDKSVMKRLADAKIKTEELLGQLEKIARDEWAKDPKAPNFDLAVSLSQA